MLHDPVLREIGALTRTIHSIIEVKFKELNLQKGQSFYLTRICENPGINLMQLSQLLMVDKTTTTKVVQKLIKENLIIKKTAPEDKRAFKLYPTDQANEVYRIIIEEENRLTAKCYQDFDKDQQTLVLSMIRKMRQNVDADWFDLKNYRPHE